LLVGAEPLVRNLLIGRRVCERFGAWPSRVGYLPDSFGHPLQLPQILAGFGIGSFVFSRGLGDELDEVGLVFRWRAPEGSEVLAIQQLPSYSNFAYVDDWDAARERIEGIAERFGDLLTAAGVRELLLCAGDDHVRVQPDLPTLCAEIERRVPGCEVRIARYADYVDALRPRELPVWSGELLGSRLHNVLRGVNSARLYLKQANERAERRMLGAETLAALRALRTGEPFPVSDFRMAWRQLLRCHPHDSICGCSCDEVHRDMLVRYELLDRTLDTLSGEALGDAWHGGAGPAVSLVNVLPERRRGLVEVDGMEPVLVEVDGFSARVVALSPAARPPAPASAPTPTRGRAIQSDLIRVEAADDGTLSMLDKQSGRRYERLHRLEDEQDMGDLYNFCPVEGAPAWRSESATARVLRAGPVIWELELGVAAERPAGLDGARGQLTVTTIVRLVRGSRRIEFRTVLDNQARDHRLRAVFPVGAVEGPLRAEGQFAVVSRPLRPVEPRAEWVEPPDPTQHTLGAVALGPLALLTKGLPEYEARLDGEAGAELCLTLLRAVGVISQPSGAIATRPLGAGPQVETPDGQCLGRHELEYALLLGADSLDATALLRASQDYRTPFVLGPAGAEFDPPLSLDGEVVFSCLKGAEDGDGLILRCFNAGDAPARVGIGGNVEVSRVRLDESPDAPSTTELRPGELGTFRLRPAG
jgi:alpha-mannosidase